MLVDWRFAKHVDLYAGVMYYRVSGGIANGYAAASTTNAGAFNPALGRSSASSWNPAAGLRYQF